MKVNRPANIPKKKVIQRPPARQSAEPGFFRKYLEAILLALVLAVTLFIYAPALNHRFTNWDDIDYVTGNLVIKSLTPENLNHILTKPIAANYHPLTMLSLALNYRFAELEPMSYFLFNIILHLFNVVLVYYFALLVLVRRKPLALFVAAIFAVHPMHVESVAWISERKDVLYAFFFLSGLIAWIKYIPQRRWTWYLASLLLFVLSGLSKPSSVVFPLVLFLLDYLFRRKLSIPLFLEKLPFLAVSAGIGIATLYAQIGSAVAPIDNYTVFHRILFASYGFFIYVFKLLVPYGLSTLHSFPEPKKLLDLPWLYFLAPAINILVIGYVVYSMRFTRMLFFCLMFYFLNIVLTLQFMQVGSAVISERYTYVSYIGLLVGISWLLNHAAEKKLLPLKYSYTIISFYFVVMTVLGYQRVPVWESSATLWTDVIAKYPDNSAAYNSRGYYYLKKKEFEKGLPDFLKAVELKPTYLDALNNLGSTYRSLNNPRLAISVYNQALTIDSNFVMAISGRGNAYFTMNILDSAMTDFNRALSIEPSLAVALGNRGAVYFRMGNFERTIADCSRAIELDPFNDDARLNRAVAYSSLEKWDEAISDYTQVLKTVTDNASIYEWRGIALRTKKLYKQAIDDFTVAGRLDPKRSSVYVNRAIAFRLAGMNAEAAGDVKTARMLGAGVTEQTLFAGLK